MGRWGVRLIRWRRTKDKKPITLEEVIIRDAPKRDPFNGFWRKVDYYWNGGIYDGFRYDIEGKPLWRAPMIGIPPSFNLVKAFKLVKITSSVKKDSKLLKLARETFKGNDKLRKEANALTDQIRKGNESFWKLRTIIIWWYIPSVKKFPTIAFYIY